jgi:hypothetical protein
VNANDSAFPLAAIKLNRFRQMRTIAKHRGKSVPSMEELEALLPLDMNCPICKRAMNWRSAEGRSTVITLQHDRSGAHRLICHACNTRHAKMAGDSFYALPADHKRCPKCESIKPISEFWKDRSGERWKDTYAYCKSCSAANTRSWRSKNLERAKRYQREYYHARKAAGNPIPRRSKQNALLVEIAKPAQS